MVCAEARRPQSCKTRDAKHEARIEQFRDRLLLLVHDPAPDSLGPWFSQQQQQRL